jgi:methionine-S-sulfoxide reductase
MSRLVGVVGIASVLAAGASFFWQAKFATESVTDAKATPEMKVALPAHARRAIFAGGCFWGVEATFRQIPGVLDTEAGYTGGTVVNPTYETLKREKTGHVEAVEVYYDPTLVRYEKLLETFFMKHDPTLPRKEGRAMGKQYRSFVFTVGFDQEKTARAVIRKLTASKQYRSAPHPIVTQVKPDGTFWPAETYHQRYYEKRNEPAHCQL